MLETVREALLHPHFVLALVVGAFHTATYLFVRGRGGWHVLAALVAACLGALAGQAVSSRIGDLVWIGEFGLLWPSLLAWAGIAVVAIPLILRPGGEREAGEPGRIRPRVERP